MLVIYLKLLVEIYVNNLYWRKISTFYSIKRRNSSNPLCVDVINGWPIGTYTASVNNQKVPLFPADQNLNKKSYWQCSDDIKAKTKTKTIRHRENYAACDRDKKNWPIKRVQVLRHRKIMYSHAKLQISAINTFIACYTANKTIKSGSTALNDTWPHYESQRHSWPRHNRADKQPSTSGSICKESPPRRRFAVGYALKSLDA